MDKMKSLFLSSLLVVVSTSGLAQNPIIQTNYTADPAPMVYNDKVYLILPMMRIILPGLR